MDEELRAELAQIKNMIQDHNMILARVTKHISADAAIQATQVEQSAELTRLRKSASKAIRKLRLLTEP